MRLSPARPGFESRRGNVFASHSVQGPTPVSEIKLIRTDTTLDLSQKAEKVCSKKGLFETALEICHGSIVGLPNPLKCTQSEKQGRDPPWWFKGILTWRGRGSCSPKRVINKARRLIEYTALHAAVCGRLWLQLRLYVRRRIFARVELCACRRHRRINKMAACPSG